MPTKKEQLQQIVTRYRLAGGVWPVDTPTIAAWAIENHLWKAHRTAEIKLCAKEISEAMREEYYTDAEGRRVRLKHPVTKKVGGAQITMWDDFRTASREHMEMAFAQRRNQIVGDCRQLKMDVDGYNALHKKEPQIQMIFDFTDDLAELEAAKSKAA